MSALQVFVENQGRAWPSALPEVLDRDGAEVKRKIPEHRVWQDMIRRCYDLKSNRYKYYGLRGIQVHESWRKSFWRFLAHIGRKPRGSYTLDRIDNDGNYEPGNVRWATWAQQARNRRHGHNRKVNSEAVKVIRYYSNGKGYKYGNKCLLARLHNTTYQAIMYINRKDTWRDS